MHEKLFDEQSFKLVAQVLLWCFCKSIQVKNIGNSEIENAVEKILNSEDAYSTYNLLFEYNIGNFIVNSIVAQITLETSADTHDARFNACKLVKSWFRNTKDNIMPSAVAMKKNFAHPNVIYQIFSNTDVFGPDEKTNALLKNLHLPSTERTSDALNFFDVSMMCVDFFEAFVKKQKDDASFEPKFWEAVKKICDSTPESVAQVQPNAPLIPPPSTHETPQQPQELKRRRSDGDGPTGEPKQPTKKPKADVAVPRKTAVEQKTTEQQAAADERAADETAAAEQAAAKRAKRVAAKQAAAEKATVEKAAAEKAAAEKAAAEQVAEQADEQAADERAADETAAAEQAAAKRAKRVAAKQAAAEKATVEKAAAEKAAAEQVAEQADEQAATEQAATEQAATEQAAAEQAAAEQATTKQTPAERQAAEIAAFMQNLQNKTKTQFNASLQAGAAEKKKASQADVATAQKKTTKKSQDEKPTTILDLTIDDSNEEDNEFPGKKRQIKKTTPDAKKKQKPTPPVGPSASAANAISAPKHTAEKASTSTSAAAAKQMEETTPDAKKIPKPTSSVVPSASAANAISAPKRTAEKASTSTSAADAKKAQKTTPGANASRDKVKKSKHDAKAEREYMLLQDMLDVLNEKTEETNASSSAAAAVNPSDVQGQLSFGKKRKENPSSK